MLTKLSKENFSKEVLESNEKVLVDFYADWCTPFSNPSQKPLRRCVTNSNITMQKQLDQLQNPH